MEKIKLNVSVQPLTSSDVRKETSGSTHKAVVANNSWNQCLNDNYDLLVNRNTNHMSLNGFRSRDKIPEVLLEIKYPSLFDSLKKEALPYVLVQVRMEVEEKLNSQIEIQHITIEPGTNELVVFFKEGNDSSTNKKKVSDNTSNKESNNMNDRNDNRNSNDHKKEDNSYTNGQRSNKESNNMNDRNDNRNNNDHKKEDNSYTNGQRGNSSSNPQGERNSERDNQNQNGNTNRGNSRNNESDTTPRKDHSSDDKEHNNNRSK